MSDLPLLDSENPVFPHPDNALENPDGLLAVGGNLAPETLINAYRQGIFPWYEDDQPLLWWSPNPRAVLFPATVIVSRSLRKTFRQKPWQVRLNTSFQDVIEHCAAPRKSQADTWITQEMKRAYLALHHSGHAHSLEVWLEDKLVGGLYGILVGSLFCGESMFSLERDASKIALVQLALIMEKTTQNGLIDCQVHNEHLRSMGAVNIPRKEFLNHLIELRDQTCLWPDQWQCNFPEKKV